MNLLPKLIHSNGGTKLDMINIHMLEREQKSSLQYVQHLVPLSVSYLLDNGFPPIKGKVEC